MKLSISNIAWQPKDDAQVATLLRAHGVGAIDIAPSKYFANPSEACAADAAQVREQWQDRGIQLAGMQSLLFGPACQGLNLFAGRGAQNRLLAYLERICALASALGIRRLVFGSPKHRDRGALGDDEVWTRASDFFARLGDIARAHEVIVCLEPNAKQYGCNFLTTFAEAATFVRRLAHPGLGLQLDTGALALAGEDMAQSLAAHAAWVRHIHLSEPGLVPLGDGATRQPEDAPLLRQYFGDSVATIEMLPGTNGQTDVLAIERALRFAGAHYPQATAVVAPSADRDAAAPPGAFAPLRYARALRPPPPAPTPAAPTPAAAPQPLAWTPPVAWQVPAYDTQAWRARTQDYAVVVPVINEGRRIARLLGRMRRLGISGQADIVLVDAGSTDGSLDAAMLQQNEVRALLTKRGAGRLSAQLRAAYAWTMMEGYRGVVTIDGNDKDDPAAIFAFVAALAAGTDFVQASRYLTGGAQENTPKVRDLAIRYLHAPALSYASGFRWTDTTQGFRAYSRRLLLDERLAIFRDIFVGYELLAYLSYRAPRLGFRCVELPTARRYPKGKVPTKIGAVRGNLGLLRTLARACTGRYNPAPPGR